ncbi:peptidoglycan-binding protein [Streptomyces sp. NPDC020801]|uniref:peptidoglycan-binding protein n=1 Tax=Streptomyces sp. NPDC020801 TaxID=3365093 RepID=UPI0037B3EF7F
MVPAVGGGSVPATSPAPDQDPDEQGVYQAFPGDGFFVSGKSSPVIRALAERLAAGGYLARGRVGSAWNSALQHGYSRWQQHLGFRGSDADGVPGRVSWDRLMVPAVGGGSVPGTSPALGQDPSERGVYQP